MRKPTFHLHLGKGVPSSLSFRGLLQQDDVGEHERLQELKASSFRIACGDLVPAVV